MENKTLKEFSELTFSKDPIPGGGGVSASVASLAASLAGMVTSLTTGKKKYAEYEEEIQEIMKKADDLRIELLDCINYDAECFKPLAQAYSLDKNSEGYQEKMEECLRLAASSPCKIFDLCTKVIELDERLAIIGSKLAVSDAATSVMLAHGAMYGAYINIVVNTRLMKDKEYANELDSKYFLALGEYSRRAYKCFDEIFKRLTNNG